MNDNPDRVMKLIQELPVTSTEPSRLFMGSPLQSCLSNETTFRRQRRRLRLSEKRLLVNSRLASFCLALLCTFFLVGFVIVLFYSFGVVLGATPLPSQDLEPTLPETESTTMSFLRSILSVQSSLPLSTTEMTEAMSESSTSDGKPLPTDAALR